METEMKAFPKTEKKMVTATIDENGDVLFLASSVNDVFLELGDVVTRRASHVEPATLPKRLFFHLLRAVFGDKGRVSNWTRGWAILWRVNAKPVGGPVLTWDDVNIVRQYAFGNDVALFSNRQSAIDAEIRFLNRFFLEGRG